MGELETAPRGSGRDADFDWQEISRNARAIAAANNLEHGAALGAGEKLIIPATQSQAEVKRRLVSYRVRRGDTLLGIADRYNVSPDDVRKWNRLRSNHVSRGMVLRIYTLGGAPEMRPARARSKSKKAARTSTNVAQNTPKPETKN